MKKLIKKYICLVFIISFLSILLYLSYNMDSVDFSNMFSKVVYATNTKESSTKTAQSSTSTTKKENNTESSDDMLDLLARVINAEARGEPYLRASCCWSCNNE